MINKKPSHFQLCYIKSLGRFKESVRDYRRYLISDPKPLDSFTVQTELDEMVEAKKDEVKQGDTSPRFGSRPSSAQTNKNSKTYFESFGTNSKFSRAKFGMAGSMEDDDMSQSEDFEEETKFPSYHKYRVRIVLSSEYIFFICNFYYLFLDYSKHMIKRKKLKESIQGTITTVKLVTLINPTTNLNNNNLIILMEHATRTALIVPMMVITPNKVHEVIKTTTNLAIVIRKTIADVMKIQH